jgi:hypothetical protein
MMVGGILRTPGIELQPATFYRIWLPMNITFTKLTQGVMLIAPGVVIFRLFKQELSFYQKLPATSMLDIYCFKFVFPVFASNKGDTID